MTAFSFQIQVHVLREMIRNTARPGKPQADKAIRLGHGRVIVTNRDNIMTSSRFAPVEYHDGGGEVVVPGPHIVQIIDSIPPAASIYVFVEEGIFGIRYGASSYRIETVPEDVDMFPMVIGKTASMCSVDAGLLRDALKRAAIIAGKSGEIIIKTRSFELTISNQKETVKEVISLPSLAREACVRVPFNLLESAVSKSGNDDVTLLLGDNFICVGSDYGTDTIIAHRVSEAV